MKKLPKSFLQKIDTLINLHLSAVDLRSILTQHLHLSPSQIYRKIKKQTGHSPSIYIRKKRLAVAHQWILETEASITEIAFSTGFQSLAYFSRCFLTEFGYSPTSLRIKNNN